MDVTAAGDMNIETARLRLESISPRLAAAIVAGRRTTKDRWHPEYPLVDELDPLQSLAANPAPDPVFTMYMIRRASDGLAIGGLGFFGPPDDSGRVEIGYGLVSAARGAGLATEAVRAALRVAAEHGATMVAADTESDNRASQHVLLKAGFVETRRDQQATFFVRPLGSPFSPARPVVYEIDGSAINNLGDLYRLLGEAVNGQGGYFGANLDAFNDCLGGGFGTPQDGNFMFLIRHSGHAISALGFDETIGQLQRRLAQCHPANRQQISRELELARLHEGPVAFEWIQATFREHHVILALDE